MFIADGVAAAITMQLMDVIVVGGAVAVVDAVLEEQIDGIAAARAVPLAAAPDLIV